MRKSCFCAKHTTLTVALLVTAVLHSCGKPSEQSQESQTCTKLCDSSFIGVARVSDMENLVKTHDVNATDAKGFTPLHIAAELNDNPQILRVLINAGADVVARSTTDESTPLHLAALGNNNPQVLTALIEAGAGINEGNDNDRTPLHFAAFNDNPQMTSALIGAGADISARTKNGHTAIHLAAAHTDNPQVLLALLDAGASFKTRDSEGASPLLHAARYNNNPLVLQALLDAGADIEARYAFDINNLEGGDTPLHWAVRHNSNPQVLEVLLDAGADIRARTIADATSLHLAAAVTGHPKIIRALVDAGAELEGHAIAMTTPLHVAALMSDQPQVLRALINAGADLNTRVDAENLMRMLAMTSDDPKTRRLASDLANMFMPPEQGFTPLHLAAASNNNPQVLRTLIDAGADVDALSIAGSTPLHFAALLNDNPQVISVLIDAGADMEARASVDEIAWLAGYLDHNAHLRELLFDESQVEESKNYNPTPLLLAAVGSGNPQVVEILLENGADANAKTAGGIGLLELARGNPNLRVAELQTRLNGTSQ